MTKVQRGMSTNSPMTQFDLWACWLRGEKSQDMLRKFTFPRVLFPQQIQSLQMMSKLHFHRIFGYYLGQRFAWLIIDLNFTDIVPDQCSADDYIEWTPTDGVSRTSGSVCCGCNAAHNALPSYWWPFCVTFAVCIRNCSSVCGWT